MRRVTIVNRPSRTTERANAEIFLCQGIRLLRDRQHHHDRQGNQSDPEKHGGPNPDDRFDRAMNAEASNHAVQRDRDEDRLETERNGSGHEQVRCLLDMRLPGDGKAQDHGMQREHVQEAVKPILVQKHQADQHQATGQQMRNVEGEAVHHKLRVTNSSSVPSSPNISAAPRNSGTRKTRILAIDVSNTASATPARVSLRRYAAMPTR